MTAFNIELTPILFGQQLDAQGIGTVTAAKTTNFASGQPYVVVLGYYTPGDGGEGIYLPTTPGPAAGKFQSADGQWWILAGAGNVINVKSLGAAGDGTTDDFGALQGALDFCSLFGGAVYLPSVAARYRSSARLEMKAAMRFYGDSPLQSQLGLSHPAADVGSTIYYDAGVAGLLVQFGNENNPSGPIIYPGSTTATIENLKFLSASVGAAASGKYGVEVRAGVTMRNIHINSFGDNGLFVNASSNGSSAAFGNTNGSLFQRIRTNGNAGDGIKILGSDTNVMTIMNCSGSTNGGYSINDQSLIGITVISHIFENSNGAYNCPGGGTPSTLIACEWESGASNIVSPNVTIIGGNFGEQSPHVPAPACFVQSGGLAFGKGYSHVNAGGGTTIGSGVGFRGASMSAFTFGINAGLGYTDYAVQYNLRGDNRWSLGPRDNNQQLVMAWPDGINTTGRGFAAEFFNGMSLGHFDAGTPSNKIIMGAAAPTTGIWSASDIVFNSAPAAAGKVGWVCTTGGWVASAAWQALHAYAVNDLVTNDSGKSYKCITAGTSASSGGPTGTGSDITDGTVHWANSAGFTFKAFGVIDA